MYNDSLYPITLAIGSTKIGKFPPILFITNRKTPTVVDLKCRGTISTKMANSIPNHISAEISGAFLIKRIPHGIREYAAIKQTVVNVDMCERVCIMSL